MANSCDMPEDAERTLAVKLAFLLQPGSYPEPTHKVTAIETHMSWVFLTDDFAYKLKKPIRLPFLDFTSLARRKYFCDEEIRLNWRLAAKVYIAVVPLTFAADNLLSLAGSGCAVDWLVKMRRLAAERMLDHAIKHGRVTREELDRLASHLCAFYRAAVPIALSPDQYRARFEVDVLANLKELASFGDALPQHQVERAHAQQLDFLGTAAQLLEYRASHRHIIEAHGDLRPEHVFLGPDPQVIDCLEFSLEFRTLDPADELSFFAMECEMLGAPAVGEHVLARYREITGDEPPPRLLDFYRCYRASLRAKIAIWHVRDPKSRDPARWPPLARRYLDLACLYADKLSTAP